MAVSGLLDEQPSLHPTFPVASHVAVEDVAAGFQNDGPGVRPPVLDLETKFVLPALDDQRVVLEPRELVLDGDLSGIHPIAVGVKVLGVQADNSQDTLLGHAGNFRTCSTSTAGRDQEGGENGGPEDGPLLCHEVEAIDGR